MLYPRLQFIFCNRQAAGAFSSQTLSLNNHLFTEIFFHELNGLKTVLIRTSSLIKVKAESDYSSPTSLLYGKKYL